MQTTPSAITPTEEHPDLARELGVNALYLKREDLHPLGSHKGRSIPHMIDMHIENEGIKRFVISGTGNASLAALRYCKQLNSAASDAGALIYLEIIVGKNIAPHKLKRLENESAGLPFISITHNDRPLQTLFVKTQDPTVRGLRQSVDAAALAGYASLGKELMAIPDLQAVFVGTSSGTTAQALAEYFHKNGSKAEVHIIQTPSCHPMTDAFESTPLTDEKSIADAIVDKVAARKEALITAVKKTGGRGWVAVNDRIREAQELTSKYAGLDISSNSALSIAGVMEAVYSGKEWSGAVACIICGE